MRKKTKSVVGSSFDSYVKKTRRPRGTGVVKEATHITEDQFLTRHMYCINAGDIERERRDALMRGTYFPKDPKAVCNYESDGLCGRSITEEQLKEVNAKLSGKSQEPEKSAHERIMDQVFPGEKGKKKLAKMVAKITKEAKGYSVLEGSKKAHKPFFCLECNEIHQSELNGIMPDPLPGIYVDHYKFKRGRGRPWQK